ncbi:MAG: hypothetical protein MUE51_01655 [Thermoleophilia bacterium]|jgi:hypothetical protein|nr:hypothetical protein [Thermoleophilia bacterium]
MSGDPIRRATGDPPDPGLWWDGIVTVIEPRATLDARPLDDFHRAVAARRAGGADAPVTSPYEAPAP